MRAIGRPDDRAVKWNTNVSAGDVRLGARAMKGFLEGAKTNGELAKESKEVR